MLVEEEEFVLTASGLFWLWLLDERALDIEGVMSLSLSIASYGGLSLSLFTEEMLRDVGRLGSVGRSMPELLETSLAWFMGKNPDRPPNLTALPCSSQSSPSHHPDSCSSSTLIKSPTSRRSSVFPSGTNSKTACMSLALLLPRALGRRDVGLLAGGGGVDPASASR